MAVATPGQVPSVPAEPPALSLEEARRGRWPSWMQPVVRLRQVPTTYREGAEALGMSPPYTMRRITMKAALPGITTGWLLALAIAIGETAPLLHTAGFSNSMPSLALTHSPISYLTYAVWAFYNYPSNTFVHLSYDAALILVVLVLLLIIAARLIVSFTQRYTEKN